MRFVMLPLLCSLLALSGCETPAAPASASDYAPLVKAACAIASLEPDVAPAPIDKPLRKDCPVCKGTGRVRSGDGLGWSECDECREEVTGDRLQAPRSEARTGGTASPWLTRCPCGVNCQCEYGDCDDDRCATADQREPTPAKVVHSIDERDPICRDGSCRPGLKTSGGEKSSTDESVEEDDDCSGGRCRSRRVGPIRRLFGRLRRR